jgi:hypothetical protein
MFASRGGAVLGRRHAQGNKLAAVPTFPIETPVDTVACQLNDRRAFAQLPMPSVAHVPRLKCSKRGIQNLGGDRCVH